MATLTTQFDALSLTPPPPPPRWLWQSDHGWYQYSDDISKYITDSINRGEPITRFDVGHITYEINTLTMLQTNYSTGFSRRILCKYGSRTKWQWKDGDDWNDYQPSVQQGIHDALQNGLPFSFSLNGHQYQVQVGQFQQVRVEGSERFIREMRQVVIQPDASPTPPVPDGRLCAICLEKAVDTMFVPCGHKACRNCANRLVGTSGKCHMCRKPIERRIALDFN